MFTNTSFSARALAVTPVFTCWLAAASGCDDPASESFGHDEESISTHDPTQIGSAAGPQVAGDYPTYPLFPPIRPDDLKPLHYPRISRGYNQGNRWHDLSIVRYRDGWSSHQPGLSGEENSVAWDTPVYAGVDGEIIACWRNNPYHPDYQPGLQQISGNYLIIWTADDRYVHYAHLDTDSIPAELCPNASDNGWMSDLSDFVDCPDNPSRDCSNLLTEVYVWPEERVPVVAGQYIGRIGAHGQAAGPHLHMRVGTVTTDANGIQSIVNDFFHITFDHSWLKTATDATPWTAWTQALGMELTDTVDDGDVLIWPGKKSEATYSGSSHLADFSGDGADDLLCHDTVGGSLYVDYALGGALVGTNWSNAAGWCSSEGQRLHTGDFNGDGRDDLLCNDIKDGTHKLRIDYADAQGRFTGTEDTASAWCIKDSEQLLVGDFDGDGDDDLLCHDHADGRRWVDLAANTGTRFGTVDTTINAGWCHGHYQRLHVGKFDGNASDDLLCHDIRSGVFYVDCAAAVASGVFGATDWMGGSWCYGGGQRLFIGNVDGLGGDDLICHDSDEGRIYVDTGLLTGMSDWTGEPDGWCTAPYQRLKIGDVNGDGSDDLVCFDQVSGQRWVDYAEDGEFEKTDWLSGSANKWCYSASQGLH